MNQTTALLSFFLGPDAGKLIRRFMRNRAALFGLSIVFLFMVLAVFAPIIATHDPLEQLRSDKLLPPFWIQGGNFSHLLGTDELGRDLFSRILFGARISMLVGVVSVGISLFFGVPLGLISGFYGGKVDQIIMRLMDIMLALPAILLAIVIVAILGPDLQNAMIAIGIVKLPQYARLTRALVISECSKDYINAAEAMGAGSMRIMFRGILPNTLSPLIVQSTLGFATAVLEAAALSFIGLGAQAPTPEWGAMLTDGKKYLIHELWWITLWPGMSIFLTVLGFNLFGDGLRDALDPKNNR